MFAPLILAASLLMEAPASVQAPVVDAARPVAAPAEITETIPLVFVPAAEVEQVLIGQPGSRDGKPSSQALLPPTLRGLSVDPSRNSLTLVGDRAGIDAVKGIIRLLDVPARRLNIELRFVRLPGGADAQGPAWRPVEDEELRDLEARPTVQVWTMPAVNNHAVTFRVPVGQDNLKQLTPRLNGDGTITLIVGRARAAEKPATDRPAKTLDDLDLQPAPMNGVSTNLRGLLALRRVSNGSVMGVAFPRGGVALLIRPTLIPAAPAPEIAR